MQSQFFQMFLAIAYVILPVNIVVWNNRMKSNENNFTDLHLLMSFFEQQ